MLCSAPVATTELSGQPSQMLAVRRAKYASGSTNAPASRIGLGWFSQSRLKPPGGSRKMMSIRKLIAPFVGSNMLRQIVATMIGGIATGMM